MKNKKIILCTLLFLLGVSPVWAKIDGRVSKSSFFDTENTLMKENAFDTTLKTGKYWEKNLFYSHKYRPIFMLSNKELYDLMPRENVSVSQRIATPSVYSISLKSAQIETISLKPITSDRLKDKPKPKPPETAKKPQNAVKYTTQYENAKNPNTDPEQKVEAAVSLKNSGSLGNLSLAIDLLDDVTKKEPYNAYAYYLKGEIFAQRHDFENAMKNYVQSLKINPTSKQCYNGIAKILEPTNKQLAQKYYAMAK